MLVRWKIPLVVILVVWFLTASSAVVFSAGTLYLNEFMSDPSEGNEWVELYYQGGDGELNLDGYWLDDDNVLMVDGSVQTGGDDPGSDPISLSGTISPNSFLQVDIGSASYLNNEGDVPSIFDDNGNLVDGYEYTSSTEKGKTYGRFGDGSGSWYKNLTATPGSPNASPPATPTPTPTPTPKSSSTPKPSTSSTGSSSVSNSTSGSGGSSNNNIVSDDGTSNARGVVAGVAVPEEIATFSADLEIEDIKPATIANEIIPIASEEADTDSGNISWWLVGLGGGLVAFSVVGLVLKKYNINLWPRKRKLETSSFDGDQ